MQTISRHAIDLELAREGIGTRKKLLASLLESAASRPQALTLVVSSARAYAGFLNAVALDTEPLCAALRTGARAVDALFALAVGTGEVEVDLGGAPIRLAATGPTDSTHSGNWRVGWWLAQIVCDQGAIARLGATPVEVVRRSSTRGDECQYLFIAALQAFERRAEDWSVRLRAALDATDPEQVKLSDEEFVLNILVPEMELLYRLGTGEAAEFNETLQFALERHKKYWSKGNRKREPDGYIALGPLSIAGMARRAGMPIEVQSDYLPGTVLEGQCCK